MYPSISSKIYIVKKIMGGSVFGGWGENLQICHAATSATRVNQGVEPWVSQRALASIPLIFFPVRFLPEEPPDSRSAYLRRNEVRKEAETASMRPDLVMPVHSPGRAIGRAVEHLVLNLPPKERACGGRRAIRKQKRPRASPGPPPKGVKSHGHRILLKTLRQSEDWHRGFAASRYKPRSRFLRLRFTRRRNDNS